MLNYKLSVTKDWKKYNIILKAENEAVARERVHNQGFSILGLEEIWEKEKIWNVFIFEWINKKWELKVWKIVGNDIFKAYVKLRKDLEYDVLKITSEEDKNISEKKKLNILNDLKEEYKLFYSSNKKEKIDELREKLDKEKTEKKKMESFHLKKKLYETNKLIELVLEKLEQILSWKIQVRLDLEKKEKLEFIYNTIVKLKKSTNITKLKEVWEKALLKIWELELEKVEETKNEENRELLKEINKLLKQIGSKEQFIEKDKDIKYQLKRIFNNFKESFKQKNKKVKEENVWIDKNSHSYMKTLLYLGKYEEKLKENNGYILKNLLKIIKDKNLREMTFLKRSVIKQNILLLKAKLKWKIYSYTFMKKGIDKIISSLLNFFNTIRIYLFIIIVIYTILFIIYVNLNFNFRIIDYNYDWLYIFLMLFAFYILLYLSRNIFLILINFVIFSFIVIFGVINF